MNGSPSFLGNVAERMKDPVTIGVYALALIGYTYG